MLSFLEFIGILVVLISIYIWRYYENVKRYPKGPKPYPIVGNLLTFNYAHAHEYLAELSQQYGPVFTVWLPRPYVAIMTYEGLKESFVVKGDDFAGRPGVFPDTIFSHIKNGGVLSADGEMWKQQRTTSVAILRDLGMGKNLMEEQVALSMRECLQFIENSDNLEQFDSKWAIQLYIANVISKTMFGIHYKYGNCDRLMTFVDRLADFFTEFRKNKMMLFAQNVPYFEKLPFFGYKAVGQYIAMMDELRVNIREDVETALEGYDVKTEPECFVQSYRQKMNWNPELTMDQLQNVCLDFFVAGMETTAATLRWAVILLADNQESQDKMREEINEVIGDRTVYMADKANMPYTSAVISEVQRHANLIPLNTRHRTTKDTSVMGHSIPMNTIVLGQIHNIMANSPVFEESKKFRPERFLLNDGVTVKKTTVEQVVPFSLGRRQCAGEALARVELFIFLVSMVQKFKISPVDGGKIDTNPMFAAVLIPKPQKLKFTKLKGAQTGTSFSLRS